MIDWSRIDDLRREIGTEDFDEIVPLFLEEADSVADELRNKPVDPSRLEEQLHFLKSSALNMGFAAFSKLCQEGETLAAQGLGADVDVAKIIHCFDESKSAFSEGLRQTANG